MTNRPRGKTRDVRTLYEKYRHVPPEQIDTPLIEFLKFIPHEIEVNPVLMLDGDPSPEEIQEMTKQLRDGWGRDQWSRQYLGEAEPADTKVIDMRGVIE